MAYSERYRAASREIGTRAEREIYNRYCNVSKAAREIGIGSDVIYILTGKRKDNDNG